MKKVVLLLFSVSLMIVLHSQVKWIHDLNMAKNVAISDNKLLLIDFWADWCAPCKNMDFRLWSLPEMEEISKAYVSVKIDIDNDLKTASLYKVTGIPKVIIATATGAELWSQVGFQFANDYFDIFKSIPANVGDLNNALLMVEKNPYNPEELLKLGMEYQKTGKTITENNLRNAFITKSNEALNKSRKKSADPMLVSKSELYIILNDVYSGRHRAALKKMEKAGSELKNNELSELKHFILACCYRLGGDQENYIREKELIADSNLLAELDNLKSKQ